MPLAAQGSINELQQGAFPWQKQSVAFARRIKLLPLSKPVLELRHRLVNQHVVPPGEPEDALHIAAAALHGVDYLLTWNFAHLANPLTQRKLEVVLKTRSLNVPLLVTPTSIPQVRFGHDLRRS